MTHYILRHINLTYMTWKHRLKETSDLAVQLPTDGMNARFKEEVK